MPITMSCPHCRGNLSAPDECAGRAVRCPHCSGTLTAPSATPPAGQPPTRQETVFLRGEGVYVSSTRLVLGNVTYAMSQVSSVQVVEDEAQAKTRGMLFVVGAIGLLVCVGIVLIIIALCMQPRYCLLIRAGGGEAHVLAGQDQSLLNQIAHAVQQAIIYRG